MNTFLPLFTILTLSIEHVPVSSNLMVVHKVECNFNQSKTCSNGFCYLTKLKSKPNLVNFGCDLIRPIYRLQVSYVETELC